MERFAAGRDEKRVIKAQLLISIFIGIHPYFRSKMNSYLGRSCNAYYDYLTYNRYENKNSDALYLVCKTV